MNEKLKSKLAKQEYLRILSECLSNSIHKKITTETTLNKDLSGDEISQVLLSLIDEGYKVVYLGNEDVAQKVLIVSDQSQDVVYCPRDESEESRTMLSNVGLIKPERTVNFDGREFDVYKYLDKRMNYILYVMFYWNEHNKNRAGK